MAHKDIDHQQLFREVSRLKALHDLSLIDSDAETVYDRFTRLAQQVLGVPISLMSLVADDYQYFKSEVGLPEPVKSERQTPLSHSFCKHVVETNEPLIVVNAPETPLVSDNLVIRDLNVVAYLGMPLTLQDGTRLGSFCAIDQQPHYWDVVEIGIMKELSQIITAEFNTRAATYLDPASHPQLEQMHVRIATLIHSLDPRMPKQEFLQQLRSARKQFDL
jgi:GAF domain-containing protein